MAQPKERGTSSNPVRLKPSDTVESEDAEGHQRPHAPHRHLQDKGGLDAWTLPPNPRFTLNIAAQKVMFAELSLLGMTLKPETYWVPIGSSENWQTINIVLASPTRDQQNRGSFASSYNTNVSSHHKEIHLTVGWKVSGKKKDPWVQKAVNSGEEKQPNWCHTHTRKHRERERESERDTRRGNRQSHTENNINIYIIYKCFSKWALVP